MGGCFSRASQAHELYIDVPRQVSTTDAWALRQKSFLSGCRLLPFTAACPASYPFQALTRVVLGDGHLFAALWEGHGGAQAARHCVAACYETVQACLRTGSSPRAALRDAVRQLDEAFLASDLPDVVKASVGATGVMLLLDTQSNQCFVARLGNAAPFVAASKGAFSTTSVDVKRLSTDTSHRREAEPEDATAAAAAPGEGLSRAIGFGYAKQPQLWQAWLKAQQQQQQQQPGAGAGRAGAYELQPRGISCDCEVTVSQLSPADDTLVLAGEGLLRMVPAHEAALLLHHFSAPKLLELQQAYRAMLDQLEAMRAEREGRADHGIGRGGRRLSDRGGSHPSAAAAASEEPPSVLTRHPNVASVVMHHALAKALDAHNRRQLQLAAQQEQQEELELEQQGSGQLEAQGVQEAQLQHGPRLLSYGELVRLPLQVDREAFRPAGAAAAGAQLLLPHGYLGSGGGLSRSDVHGDMGLVVVALNWPRPRDSLPAGPAVTPLRPGAASLRRRPAAEYRWQLLRLAVRFNLAYRRTLRQRWWDLADEVQLAAEAAARQAEVHAWKTLGAAVKVNLTGDMMAPEARSSHALRAHASPEKPAWRGGTQQHTPPAARPAPPSPAASLGSLSSGAGAAAGPAAHGGSPAGAAQLGLRGGRRIAELRVSTASAQRQEEEEDADETVSDVDSPSRLDSPKKQAAAAPWSAGSPSRTAKAAGGGSGGGSPAYAKQGLSLRGGGRAAAGAGSRGGGRADAAAKAPAARAGGGQVSPAPRPGGAGGSPAASQRLSLRTARKPALW